MMPITDSPDANVQSLVDKQNCSEFQKATPAHIRANIRGAEMWFEIADRFQGWIDDPSVIHDAQGKSQRATDDSGVLSRVTQLVRG